MRCLREWIETWRIGRVAGNSSRLMVLNRIVADSRRIISASSAALSQYISSSRRRRGALRPCSAPSNFVKSEARLSPTMSMRSVSSCRSAALDRSVRSSSEMGHATRSAADGVSGWYGVVTDRPLRVLDINAERLERTRASGDERLRYRGVGFNNLCRRMRGRRQHPSLC